MSGMEVISTLGPPAWRHLTRSQDSNKTINSLAAGIRDARSYQLAGASSETPSHYYEKRMDAAVSQAMGALIQRVTLGPGTPALRYIRLSLLTAGLILAILVADYAADKYFSPDGSPLVGGLLLTLMGLVTLAHIASAVMAVAHLARAIRDESRHGDSLKAMLPTRLDEQGHIEEAEALRAHMARKRGQ